MTTPEFYTLQADACARAALTADLPQQKDRYMRAQVAWQILADKKIEEAAGRTRRLEEKRVATEALDVPESHPAA